MDRFVLLPFYLLSYISTPGNDTWLHGPVNTYLVDFNVTFPNYPDNTKSIGFHAMLKCRPQGFDVLNCFLDNSRMAFKDSDMYKEDESYRINELFLIKFDRRGVRHLMVSPRLTPWQLGVLRTIANQLNFGVDLLDKSNSTFNDIERSYIGECDSFVNISREVRDIERPPGKENFEIISMAGFRKRHNEVVEIEKRRNLENCIHRNEYMFLDPRHPANPQIMSSHSWIEISDTNYDSYTVNVFNLKIDENTTMVIHEKIAVNLTSVVPSLEELPPFSDLETVDLYMPN